VTPEVSVVVVNHRSAEHACRCVESLRSCFTSEGISGEVLLVDCDSGEEESRRLARAGADLLLLLPENRGYSGGVNAGLARACGGRLILSNADVVYLPGALAPLLEAIDEPSVGAAAPLTFWDAGGALRLPPGYAPGFWRDLAQLSGARFPWLDERRFAAFARETLALWERGGKARHLSGAVLAARRDVFDRVGRFDEQFPFEFEETEWEDRVRKSGLDLAFVPRSRVRHLWAHSAADGAETGRRRAASRRLYRQRRYGRLGRAVLDALDDAAAPALRLPRLEEPFFAPRAGATLALSPNPSLLPFAGASLAEGFRLPEEIVSDLPPALFYFRTFRDSDGRPLETRVWEKRR